MFCEPAYRPERRVPGILGKAQSRRVPGRRVQADRQGWQGDLDSSLLQSDPRPQRQAVQGRQVRLRHHRAEAGAGSHGSQERQDRRPTRTPKSSKVSGVLSAVANGDLTQHYDVASSDAGHVATPTAPSARSPTAVNSMCKNSARGVQQPDPQRGPVGQHLDGALRHRHATRQRRRRDQRPVDHRGRGRRRDVDQHEEHGRRHRAA